MRFYDFLNFLPRRSIMTEEYYRLRGAVINNLPELILDDEDAIVWLTAFRGRWVRNVFACLCPLSSLTGGPRFPLLRNWMSSLSSTRPIPMYSAR